MKTFKETYFIVADKYGNEISSDKYNKIEDAKNHKDKQDIVVCVTYEVMKYDDGTFFLETTSKSIVNC
jgi:hypothetical protein